MITRLGAENAFQLVQYFCCDPGTARYGPFHGLEDDEELCTELLEGRLYSFRLMDNEDSLQSVDLQVYIGLSELGGLLWEQEIRALSRISGTGHPALPELLGGGYEDKEATAAVGIPVDGAAFVAARGGDYTLHQSEMAAAYRKDQAEALRQFAHLADGLAVLHDLGLAHRNLWPAAIDVVGDGGSGRFRLRLARFELSAFVSSLLSGTTIDSVGSREKVRQLFLDQGPQPLAYLSPERVRFLLPLDDDKGRVESAKSDVYGLAAIVWEWFVGPFPEELLPRQVPRDPAEIRAERDRLERLNAHLRRSLLTADAPEPLRALLHRMLDPDPAGRPTSTEVINELSAAHDSIVAGFGAETDTKPYLVAFMPEQCKLTLGKWGWLEHDPTTREGKKEVAELLSDDLKRAQVTYSPHGADPFVVTTDNIQSQREARTVLVGERAVWFGQLFRPPVPGTGLGEAMPEVLLIKYVARRDSYEVRTRLDELFELSERRWLPEVNPIPYDIARHALDRLCKDRPHWDKLQEAVQRGVGGVSEAELDYQKAIDWLLEFQGVELRARCYPYRLDPHASTADEVLLYWDRSRDEDRIFRSPLFTKYARNLRSDFGDFFGQLENEDGSARVQVYAGERDRRRPGDVAVTAHVVRREGPDRIVLRREPGQPPVPSEGWIRPMDDIGTEIVLRRQTDARWELFALKPLTTRLRNPDAFRSLPHRWRDAGRGLHGGGAQAVRDMLSFEPFYALQGPPGTGKSTVTSQAVAAYLKEEPTHRILVSAQSNYTLDNLAARILRDIGAMDDNGPTDRLKDVPIALRIVSERANPDDTVKPWMRDDLTVRRARQMRTHVDRLLAGGVDDRLRPVLGRWRELLVAKDGESIHPELADRLQRGANIVFATCGTATPRQIGAGAGATAFDWVIVEEAAKAWPTELAIPLVRGTRWTLIGDHHQLPAHRRDDVVRFLYSCVDDPNPAIAVVGEKLRTYLDAFDLFRHLFEPRPGKRVRPVSRLTTQYRMRPAIAEIVSRVFYPDGAEPLADGLPKGGLATVHDDRPTPLTAPAWLKGRSLVWLDTAGLPDCAEQPYWSNEGEAALVNSLVESLHPRPLPHRDGFSGEPLAVLTPYRRQLEALKRYRSIASHAYTIHAFQGREADMVIVSLVRDKFRGADRGPAASYGHLCHQDLINVMFSRARRLLVIVGNFEHYARYEDGDRNFWQQVCRGVEKYGVVRRVADLAYAEELA